MGRMFKVVASLTRQMCEGAIVAVGPIDWARRHLHARLSTVSSVASRALLLQRLLNLENRGGNWLAVESVARELLNLCPDDAWTQIELALVLERLGKIRE